MVTGRPVGGATQGPSNLNQTSFSRMCGKHGQFSAKVNKIRDGSKNGHWTIREGPCVVTLEHSTVIWRSASRVLRSAT